MNGPKIIARKSRHTDEELNTCFDNISFVILAGDEEVKT